MSEYVIGSGVIRVWRDRKENTGPTERRAAPVARDVWEDLSEDLTSEWGHEEREGGDHEHACAKESRCKYSLGYFQALSSSVSCWSQTASAAAFDS